MLRFVEDVDVDIDDDDDDDDDDDVMSSRHLLVCLSLLFTDMRARFNPQMMHSDTTDAAVSLSLPLALDSLRSTKIASGSFCNATASAIEASSASPIRRPSKQSLACLFCNVLLRALRSL